MIKVIAIVYWTFKNDKKQTTPYFSTCLIVTLLLVINFISLALLLGIHYNAFAVKFSDNDKINKWVNSILQGSLIWLIFFGLFPKKKLETYEFSDETLSKSKKVLIGSVIASIVLMTCLLIKSGIDRGLIK